MEQQHRIKSELQKAKLNAEEDYKTTPISVLKYITELESKIGRLESDLLASVIRKSWIDTEKQP